MKRSAASTPPRYETVYTRLRRILEKYAGPTLQVRTNEQGDYVLTGPPTEKSPSREVWFGGVGVRTRYVSYHLMPVYAFPELLEGLSPELRKQMQGKACFNFKIVDEKLFKELAQLTDRSYRKYVKEKLIDSK